MINNLVEEYFLFLSTYILSVLGFEPKTPGLKGRHSTIKLYTLVPSFLNIKFIFIFY